MAYREVIGACINPFNNNRRRLIQIEVTIIKCSVYPFASIRGWWWCGGGVVWWWWEGMGEREGGGGGNRGG